jgi:hypothetical protein
VVVDNEAKKMAAQAAKKFAGEPPEEVVRCKTCNHALSREYIAVVIGEVKAGRSKQNMNTTYMAVVKFCDEQNDPYPCKMGGFGNHWRNCMGMRER